MIIQLLNLTLDVGMIGLSFWWACRNKHRWPMAIFPFMLGLHGSIFYIVTIFNWPFDMNSTDTNVWSGLLRLNSILTIFLMLFASDKTSYQKG
jgi:hypothetical protein